MEFLIQIVGNFANFFKYFVILEGIQQQENVIQNWSEQLKNIRDLTQSICGDDEFPFVDVSYEN
jgi:hypothetical protein